MSKSNYPSKEELDAIFEIINGQLWRKPMTKVDGRQMSAKLRVNKVNTLDGYCQVGYNLRTVKYHVIVWILSNGDIPEGFIIDHIDGNKINNDISNLRLVTHRQNSQNMNLHREGRLPGASYNSQHRKWHSQIWIEGRGKQLGYYDTELEAHEAYIKANDLLNNDS